MGIPTVEWLNYIFVWNAVHFLGYAWVDGRIASLRHSMKIAAGGLASLATLVTLFPYPLAMVGLDNTAVTNSNPPKVTLIALGAFQFGLAMSLAPAASRWLATGPAWSPSMGRS